MPDDIVRAGTMSTNELVYDFIGSNLAAENAQVNPLGVTVPGAGVDGADLVIDQIIQDRQLEAIIRRQARWVERQLEVRFSPTQFATYPEIASGDTPALVQGVDYDRLDDPYAWDTNFSGLIQGKINLRNSPVIQINRIRFFFGRRPYYEIPVRWAVLNRSSGIVEFMVDGVGNIELEEQVVWSEQLIADLHNELRRSRTPGAWAFDYEAGGVNTYLEDFEDIKGIVGWRAAAEVLSVAAIKANTLAVQSQSVSKDGVSRSMSVSDSGPGGRFARLLDSDIIKQWTGQDRIQELKVQVKSFGGPIG